MESIKPGLRNAWLPFTLNDCPLRPLVFSPSAFCAVQVVLVILVIGMLGGHIFVLIAVLRPRFALQRAILICQIDWLLDTISPLREHPSTGRQSCGNGSTLRHPVCNRIFAVLNDPEK